VTLRVGPETITNLIATLTAKCGAQRATDRFADVLAFPGFRIVAE
jgi:hypothetical protein